MKKKGRGKWVLFAEVIPDRPVTFVVHVMYTFLKKEKKKKKRKRGRTMKRRVRHVATSNYSSADSEVMHRPTNRVTGTFPPSAREKKKGERTRGRKKKKSSTPGVAGGGGRWAEAQSSLSTNQRGRINLEGEKEKR